jgi:uncharacterized membrane protein YgcG
MKLKQFLGIYFLFLSCTANAVQEHILSFKSAITVHTNSSLTVKEVITVISTGMIIKHGLVREFPTIYKDAQGNTYTVGFELQQVLQDDQPVPYQIKDAPNGKKIYIGEPHRVLSPGTYTYTLVYTTDKQLGFFQEHDELYWNVTGNGWRLPIERATAYVHLPLSIPKEKIHVEAYTGRQGERGKDYTAHVTEKGIAIVSTTRTLAPFEGLTIVVTWPKGFVVQASEGGSFAGKAAPTPSRFATKFPLLYKIYLFLRDYLATMWLLLGLLGILFFYLRRYRKTRSFEQATIIPLFEPPAGLLPSQVRYLYNRKYDPNTFASEIVTMAVKGLLEIKFTKGLLFGGTYTLISNDAVSPNSHKDHVMLHSLLFSNGKEIELSKKNQKIIGKATRYLQESLESFSQKYLDSNLDTLFIGVVVSLGFLFTSLIMPQATPLFTLTPAFFGALILFIIINGLFSYLLYTYTPEGYKLYAAIEGFKLFLKTTEEERLKVIGTPPTKTPELYEKYLPYAIALGVEKAWSSQFAPVFTEYEKEGHPYVPVWYMGPTFRPESFNSSFVHSINSVAGAVISSAPTIPGTRSGSGGRGSSGGGGGGGGGGGW